MRTYRQFPSRAEGSLRSWVLVALAALTLAWLGLVLAVLMLPRVPHEAQQTPAEGVQEGSSEEPQSVTVTPSTPPRRPEIVTARPMQPGRNLVGPPASGETIQLVESLVKPEAQGGVLTPEQVAAWKQRLEELVRLGPAALPAIREFLDKNVDFDFGPGGKQMLGYSTARGALFDALAQIGGSDALAMLSSVLQSTADPREVGLLAQKLEQLEPGQHQSEALDAARQTLAMATGGNLSGRDVAPLFELFQKFGDAGAVADLEASASKWGFYASLTLAQLPDGAGIPSLLKLAGDQNSAYSGARTAALEMLAQVATQSSEARASLLDQTRLQKLTAQDLAAMAPMLAGDQMLLQNSVSDNALAGVNPGDLRKSYMPASNQSLFTAPLGALTVEQINERKALIDELLSAAADPASVQALQRAKAMLLKRLPQMAAAFGG